MPTPLTMPSPLPRLSLYLSFRCLIVVLHFFYWDVMAFLAKTIAAQFALLLHFMLENFPLTIKVAQYTIIGNVGRFVISLNA